MSLGAGIFLSVLIVCLLVLYLATRDRWRWKRLMLGGVGLIIVLIAIGWGFFWLQDIITNRPVAQTEYQNVPLGASKDEVIYRLGQPGLVYREMTDEEKKNTPATDQDNLVTVNKDGKYPEGKAAMDFNYWSFDRTPRSATLVVFTDNKVSRISCLTLDENYCPSLLHVNTGDTEDQVLARLGQPTETKLETDTKLFSYKELNLKLRFKKQRVFMISVIK